ncbi:RNA dependent RNA polymerase-domain-containing protein [Xylariomycetidae sp. FL0641]|nr:RNA dependent RNA polymerase-domain-containing protein [Xylariomycetidae sp. FL0641]
MEKAEPPQQDEGTPVNGVVSEPRHSSPSEIAALIELGAQAGTQTSPPTASTIGGRVKNIETTTVEADSYPHAHPSGVPRNDARAVTQWPSGPGQRITPASTPNLLAGPVARNGNRPGFAPSNHQDWRNWRELTVRITLNNRKARGTFGTITWIEIREDGHGDRDGSALVRFAPPPRIAFWLKPFSITIAGKQVRMVAQKLSPRAMPIIRTPNNTSFPAQTTLTPTSIQFGVMASEKEFMAMRTLTVGREPKESSFVVDLKSSRKKLEFRSKYHASFRVFYKKHDVASSHTASSNWSLETNAWYRAVDIVYDTAWFKDQPVTLPRANHFIDMGRWITYRFTFPNSLRSTWETTRGALRAYNIETTTIPADKFTVVPPSTSNFWDILEPQRDGQTPSSNLDLLSRLEDDLYLPYNVRYQLEVCISCGYLNEVNIQKDFLRKLAELSKQLSEERSKKRIKEPSREPPRRRDRAEDLLTYVAESCAEKTGKESNKINEDRIYNPMALFEDRKALSHYPEIGLVDHCVWVRKVVVTPTTMYLSTPIPEPSNRVLRKYSRLNDRFLRVQFTDEQVKGRIFSSPNTSDQNALFNRIFRTLLNGIRIGGRKFSFLAFGNSQFRENGAYFFAETDLTTCDDIRKWMGDFTHIKIVAKYAARLGQCFSTTRAPKLFPIGQDVKLIDDIERNGICFSDGVGKISPKLVTYIAKRQKLAKRYPPSAYQFRLGGSKGLLICWPDVQFNEILLRPSQKKFTADDQGLEIIKVSRYSVATLNRQTIMILSCLGVPDEVFVNMLTAQVEGYRQAMDDPEKAMGLLSRFVDQNGTTTLIAQMIRDGFMHIQEPFFTSVLQVWRAWSMRLLREKARIVVEKGAFVFGCVDETFTLRGHHDEATQSADSKEHNLPQIFLQVPKPDSTTDEYVVITGICVVGRNPSLHPGDIRVVEAVDIPALRHIRDVVVFPATGDRDIPSMCSGGDLDGDDFFVFWDPLLIPKQWNHAPMVHDTLNPTVLDRDVRPSDLIQFFVTYMKNDQLSTIALAHLARADALVDGPKNPLCIELAQLHSQAVDYSKSGQPAVMKKSLQPRRWPHFMEKPSGTYHSKKVLGQLYDLTTRVDFTPKYNADFDKRILCRFALDDEMLKNARIIKKQHDKALRQIMNQREIQTELEVWSTFILTKPRVGNDYRMQETMGPVVTGHQARFRAACIKVAGSRDSTVLYPLVAATYRVTWEEVQIAMTRPRQTEEDEEAQAFPQLQESMPLISFPWIFSQELGRIAKMQEEAELQEVPQVHAAVPANTFAIYGNGEDKELTELVPGILNQLGPDSLASLRKLAESYQSMSKENKEAEADDDDIPDLVAGENFESKVE